MPLTSFASLCPQRFAEQEFSGARLGDQRRSHRLQNIVVRFAAQPTASIPKACGSWKDTKATYRFFSNPQIRPADLIAPHQEQTRQRSAQQPVVLVVQDTTGLNFSADAGLGLLGSGPEGAPGLWLHSSLAFTPEGQALGVLHVETWQRDRRDFGKAARRHQRVTAQKESQRWLTSHQECVRLAAGLPATRLVNVADREGDLYPLFTQAAAQPQVGVLVRARHNRRTDTGQLLEEVLENTPSSGAVPLSLPHRPGQRARTVQLVVKFCAVKLPPPRHGRGDALGMWVVEAREVGPRRGPPLHWRLVTNLPVPDLAAAQEQLRWYRVRWQIEEFHRVLKSGCNAEGRQLESADRLLKVLMVDLVIAWRVLALSRLARQDPEAPADPHFSAPELEIIRHWSRQHLGREVRGPNLRAAVRVVAQMGGFLARKRDGEPGAMTLWRGLEMLSSMLIGWNLSRCG
jgi:Transposase DNA-binding/Transposase Tn5 dimerisation domain